MRPPSQLIQVLHRYLSHSDAVRRGGIKWLGAPNPNSEPHHEREIVRNLDSRVAVSMSEVV